MSILDSFRNKDGKVVAYKVFNPDWTCRDFKFEVGKIYKEGVSPSLCNKGFHACLKIGDCFSYYAFDPTNKVAEVLLGEDCVEPGDGCSKVCSSEIEILKEIEWSTVMIIANGGLHNTGHSNSGDRNSGNRNSGHSNSGDWNSGHRNSGNRNSGHSNSGDWNSGHSNSGDWNSGDRNSGDRNSGDWNSGDWNSGHRNSGDRNSGNRNSGHSNSGDWNSGHRNSGHRNSGNRNSGHRNSGNRNSGHSNSGHRNSGDWNSGHRNSGDWNSGHRNSGDWNSGHRNSGDWNSGDWNSGDRNSGFFNTFTPETIFVFNKEVSRYIWDSCYKPDFLYFNLTEWVAEDDMSDKDKLENPSYPFTNGFLKKYKYKEAFIKSWNNADPNDRMKVKNLPNFDEDVFFEISGIRVSDYE